MSRFVCITREKTFIKTQQHPIHFRSQLLDGTVGVTCRGSEYIVTVNLRVYCTQYREGDRCANAHSALVYQLYEFIDAVARLDSCMRLITGLSSGIVMCLERIGRDFEHQDFTISILTNT